MGQVKMRGGTAIRLVVVALLCGLGALLAFTNAPPGSSVGLTATTTALTAAPSPSVFGQGVTLTATVTAATGTPTGTVQFRDGASNIGPATPLDATGAATLLTASLSVGAHSLSAVYSPAAGTPFAASSGTASHTVGALACTRTVSGGAGSPPSVIANAGEIVCVTGAINSVNAKPGSGVIITDANVGTTVAANATTIFKLCSSVVGGAVTVRNAVGWVLVGDQGNDEGVGCGSNNLRSTVLLADNDASSEIGGNTIGSTLTVRSITGTGPYPDDTAVEVSGNQVGSTLACTNNDPPPVSGGVPNSAAGGATGQCAGTLPAYANTAPTIFVPGPQTIAEDTSVVLNGGSAITVADVDGGAAAERLSIVATHGVTTLGSLAGLAFSTGDGTADPTMVFTGTLANLNTALNGLRFIPDANYNGPAGLTVTINDLGNTGAGGPKSASAAVNVLVTEVNDSPVAVNDAKSTAEDTPLVFAATGLTTNDNPGPLEGSQTITVTAVGTASHGTVGLVAGTITYTPAADYNGPDSFTYTITDNGTTNGVADPKTAMATVNVTLTEVNDAPTAVADDKNGFPNTVLSFPASDLVTNDIKGPANESGQTLMVSAVTATANTHGTVGLSAGTVTYTPTTGFAGVASFSYTVTDNGTTNGAPDAKSSTGTVTVTLNRPPVAVDDGPYTLNEDGSFILADPGIKANDTDPDLDALTVKLPVDVLPAHGTLAQNAAGGFTYTPAANYNGTDSFKYRVNDGFADSNQATVSFTVNAVPDAPTDVTLTPNAAAENQTAVGTLSTTDVDLPGDSHTYSFAAGGTDNTSFAISGNQLSFVSPPDFETKSSYSIKIRSTDSTTPTGLFFEKILTVTVTNVPEAPTSVAPAGTVAATEDTALGFTSGNALSVADSDGGSLTVTLAATHGNLNLGTTTGLSFGGGGNGTASMTVTGTIVALNNALASLSFAPTPDYNGAASLTFTTTDGVFPNVVKTVNISIAAVADITNDSITTNEDTPITFNVLTGTNGASADNFEGTPSVSAVGAVTPGSLGSVSFLANGAITFTPSTNQNGGGTFSYTVTSGGVTETATVTMTVTPVNDPPTATNLSAAETYTEDTALNLTDIVVADVDNANLTVTLTLSNTAAGALSTAISGAVTSTYVSGVWTASGLIADVNTLLAGVTFNPALNFNGNFSIATSVTDTVAAPVTGSKAVTGTAVNDAPVLADTTLSLATVSEDPGAPVGAVGTLVSALAAFGNNVADPDAGAVVGIAIIGVDTSQGAGFYSTDGGLSWNALGAPSGGSARLLNAAARVYFQPNLNVNGTIATALTLRAWDQTSGTNGGTASANSNGGATAFSSALDTVSQAVTPVNDPPTATNLSAAETYTEDTALNLTDIVVADVDNANLTVTLTLSNTAAGALSTATSGAVTSTYVSGTGVWTASGAIANVNTLLAGVTFNPAANFNGNFTIATSVTDAIAAPVTGTKTITGTPVNDAPVANPETYSVVGGSLTVAAPGVLGNDTDVDTPDTKTAVLDTQPLHQTAAFVLNGDGSFTYTANVSNGSDSFTYHVVDSATASSNVTTVTLNLNQPPVAVNDTATTNEDTAVLIDLSGNDTDPDNANSALTAVNIIQGTGGTAVLQSGNRSVLFTPNGDFNGVTNFTYQASDGSSTSTNTATVTITVAAVNDAPVNHMPTAPSTNEDTPLTLSGPGAISISDVDAGSSSVQVALAVNWGTATLNGTTGLSFSAGDGTADASMTFTGTIANINAALDGMTFIPAPDYSGVAVAGIQITTNDLGNTGSGGAKSDADFLTITVIAVNDAPVLAAIEAGTLPYTENALATVVTSTVTLSDVDSANITGATAQITGNFQSGQDVLSLSDIFNITADAFDTATGKLTLSGTDTQAHYETALRSIRYTNTSDNPSTLLRTVSFQVDDGSAVNHASNTVTRTITITAVNDAPTVTTSSGTVNFTEDGPVVVVDNLITVADLDSTTFNQATISISANFTAGEDTLDFSCGALCGGYSPSTGVATISGSGTLAQYQAILRTVTYANSSQNPNTATRTISFTLRDIDGPTVSAAATRNVTVTAVNDAPVLAAIEAATLPYTENAPATAITSTMTLADVDSANMTGATAQITGNYQSGEDVLSFANISPITATAFDTATGKITLSGSDTKANYQAALRTIKYANTSDNPSTAVRTVTFRANDGGVVNNLSNTQTRTITVTPVNDAPVVTTSAGSLGYIENDPAKIIDGGITVTDVDSANITGATVSVSSILAEDVLSFATIGPISGTYAPGTGVLTLSGTDTKANYEAALRTVTYQNSSDNPTASRTISFQVDDGAVANHASNVATRGIAITAQNDAPVNSVPLAAQNGTEDVPLVFNASNGNLITIADVDAGSATNVSVTLTADNGTVALGTTSGLTSVTGNSTNNVVATGTVSALNTALNGTTFLGNANYNVNSIGSNSLQIVTNDNGNTGTPPPGALSDTDTIAITLAAVNDLPVPQVKSLSVQTNMGLDNRNLSLTTGVTDPDSGDPGFVASYTVASIGIGTCGGNLTDVQLGAGTFDYDPAAGFTGNCALSYTLTDTCCGSPASATSLATNINVTVSGPVIWFVDDTAATGANDGRLSSPFKTLAAADAAIGANTGQRTFLYSGTYTTGMTMASSEWLIGQGVTGSGGTPFDTLFGITPPSATIARPSLSGTRPIVQGNVDMDTSDQVKGLNIQPASGTQGLSASSATSLVTSEVSITTTSAVALNLVSSDGTFSFTKITATTAPGGIIWNNTTNATGSLTVTGDGTGAQNNTGGIISSPTSHGIFLNKANDVVLKSMSITSPSGVIHHGILANDLLGSSSAWTGLVITGVTDSQSSSVELANTAGGSTTLGGLAVSGSKIANSSSGRTAFLVEDRNNSPMTLSVTTTEFSGLFPVAAQFVSGNNTGATGTVTVSFTNNTLKDAPAAGANSVNFAAINGSLLNATVTGNTATAVGLPVASIGVFSVSAQNTARVNAKLNSNTISNITGYQAFNVGTEDSGRLDAQIDGNTVTNTQSTAIRTVFNKTSTVENLTITNNTLGTTADPVGKNTNGTAINMDGGLITGGTGAANVLVSNNTMVTNPIGGSARESLQLAVSGPTTYNLTATNNTITNQNGNEAYFDSVAVTPGNICMDFTGNGSGSPDVTFNKELSATAPFVLRNRDSVAANNPSAVLHFLPSQPAFGTQTTACTQPTLPPI